MLGLELLVCCVVDRTLNGSKLSNVELACK